MTALLLDAQALEARLRSAQAALQGGRFDEALALTAPLLEDGRAGEAARGLHAAALAASGRPLEAAPLLQRAVDARPDDVGALVRFLAVLDRLGRFEEVEARARVAMGRGRGDPNLRLLFARALTGLGQDAEAETVLRDLVRAAPDFREAQEGLANSVWMRTGDTRAALKEIEAALKAGRAPAPPLLVLKAQLLSYAGDGEGAYAVLAEALRKPGAPPGLHVAAAQMSNDRDPVLAARHAEAARRSIGDHPDVLLSLAEARLAEGRGAEAEAALRPLLAQSPQDQHLVALLATALRLQGKAEWGALYDYGRFVGVYELAPPAGWSDLPAFLADLAAALGRLHTHQTHPVGQSLRHGTQTTQNLLVSRNPVIRALFAALDAPIRRHVSALAALAPMPGDPGRLLERNRGGYAYAGAWSVRLKAGRGAHVDHIHPQGWLSSAFYVETPPATQGDDRAGWLRFGQPGQATRPALPPEHWVRPQPGRLVLFPSYMWHGVAPFAGEAPRLTVAFDLTPDAETPAFGG